MQLLQGKRRSHFCLRRKHSTQLYCSRGRLADFLSSLLSSCVASLDDEDACWSIEASALMVELSERSFFGREGEALG